MTITLTEQQRAAAASGAAVPVEDPATGARYVLLSAAAFAARPAASPPAASPPADADPSTGADPYGLGPGYEYDDGPSDPEDWYPAVAAALADAGGDDWNASDFAADAPPPPVPRKADDAA